MEDWKKIQKANMVKELSSIIIISLLFILGIIFDWGVRSKGIILIPMDTIESFSLAIVQIQATVGTLIFTITTLIAGNVSDSHMGVSISDFYLNIKPWKLTQKRLIIMVLALNLYSIILHSLGCYNTVFFLFISTLIAILISITEIYSALKGKNKQHQEIEAFINFMLDSNITYENKLNIFNNFVFDWKKIVNTQDNQSYEESMEIFKKYVCSLLKYGNEESFISTEQQCYNILYCLLGSDRKKSKETGIEFIQEIYDTMWNFIHTDFIGSNLSLNTTKNKFPLFSDICDVLVDSLEELNVEDVERRLRFYYLVDSVLRVNIWLEYYKRENFDIEKDESDINKTRFNYRNEINELNSFARYLGYYLGKMNNKNNIINQNLWASVLSRRNIFSSYNIPDKYTEEFLNAKLYTYFSYCYGMMVNGQENIVKNGIYLSGMRNIVGSSSKYQTLFYLIVHCYIFYLAIREYDNCVTNDIRQSALNLWEDKDVQNFFIELLNELSGTPEWLNSSTRVQIYEVLDKFELFPHNMDAKCMIMETVVSDFYLFLVLYISSEFILPDLLEQNIDDLWAFSYISKGNEYRTKNMLKQLYLMIPIENKSEEQINDKINSMYESLETMVKQKQKERYIKQAKEAQKNYETKINIEEIRNKIKDDITKLINNKFHSILAKDDKMNKTIKIPILSITDYTKSLELKNNTNNYYSYIDGNFLLQIIRYLIDKKAVDFKNRFDDFIDDKDFMKFLSENDLHLLLGSKYILKNRDYRIRDEYQKFLEDYDIAYTSVLREGVALKRNSIKVCLHDVYVSIHSPTIKELNIEYDEKTRKYKYPILNDVPIEFDKEELKEFLHNYRKIIKITAEISIQTNERHCGTIITGRKK